MAPVAGGLIGVGATLVEMVALATEPHNQFRVYFFL